ncbi:MAG: phosphatase PAP2 family protein [Rhodospirillales bacterium]|nr:phosphatase PAP2 family protein [Rhodospirillales bacterium]
MDSFLELKLALFRMLGKDAWEMLAVTGEALVLLPAAAIIAGRLWLRGSRAEALSWGTSLLLCIATVGLMKLSIGDFKWTLYGHTFNAKGFPSGHAAMATVFWAGLALIARDRLVGAMLLVPIPLASLSVLVLWWHHTLDIVAGLAIGAAALLPLALRVPRRSPRSAA